VNIDNKPYFCTAPWTHTYVSPQGERRLCCASREEASFQKQYIDSGTAEGKFEPVTLEEHWNSDYMKDIRKRMLNGEKLSQCDVCNDQILNLHTYKKYFTETLFPHKVESIIANTAPDGHYSDLPVSYDYRISNLCNFKCRMCGEQLSSSWEAEKKKLNLIDVVQEPWLEPNTRKSISDFQVEVLEEELQRAVDNKTIEEIYWVGGEPLMFERHWTIMQQLVDNGHAKNVTVRYNTNLSRVKYKNYDLWEMLPHFKNVNICASIDGAYEVGEYIRDGLVWDEWIENFKSGMFLIDQFGDDAMVFDVTLTTPGLFHLKDLFDVARELDVKSYFKFTFAFDPSVVMSPMCLPKEVSKPWCEELISYFDKNRTWKNKVYAESLRNLISRQSFDEEWPDTFRDGLKRGKEFQEFLDEKRNSKIMFRDTLRGDAIEWWDNL
tara:strand:- start:147 stop:1454 length:1308 start_codon:yes stop_codon:yes gene_type:complete